VIVQCPYCATRYRIDAARLGAPDSMLKCSRCEHVFPAPSDRLQSPASAAATEKPGRPRTEKAPAPEESLTLPFESASWKPDPEEEDAAHAPAAPEEFTIPETDDEFTIGAEEPVRSAAAELPHTPEPDPEIADEPAFTRSLVQHVEPAAAPRAAVERPRVRRPRARDSERGKMVALILFLGAVIIGYSMLTVTLFANPSLWDKWLGHLPYVGTLRDDRLLNRKVALSDVAGSYQRIKDGKEVFVITGKAMNTAPVALHGVQIAGKLYDDAGRALDEKTIHCGNVISTKVLKDLTRRELSVLQTLSPPSKFMIEPGESSMFVIVFMDPPRAAAAFTTQVVAAHRQV
jgi:predicted Zn finger-like uncharacterized protein